MNEAKSQIPEVFCVPSARYQPRITHQNTNIPNLTMRNNQTRPSPNNQPPPSRPANIPPIPSRPNLPPPNTTQRQNHPSRPQNQRTLNQNTNNTYHSNIPTPRYTNVPLVGSSNNQQAPNLTRQSQQQSQNQYLTIPYSQPTQKQQASTSQIYNNLHQYANSAYSPPQPTWNAYNTDNNNNNNNLPPPQPQRPTNTTTNLPPPRPPLAPMRTCQPPPLTQATQTQPVNSSQGDLIFKLTDEDLAWFVATQSTTEMTEYIGLILYFPRWRNLYMIHNYPPTRANTFYNYYDHTDMQVKMVWRHLLLLYLYQSILDLTTHLQYLYDLVHMQ